MNFYNLMPNTIDKRISIIIINILENNSICTDSDFLNIKSSIENSNDASSLCNFLNKAGVTFTNENGFISFKYKSFFFMFHIGNLSSYDLEIFFKVNFGNSVCISPTLYSLNSIIGICWKDEEEKINLRNPSILFKLFQKLINFHMCNIVFKNLNIENFYFSKALDQWIIKKPDDFIIKGNLQNLGLSYSPKNILENSSLYSERCLENEILVSFEEMKRK
ncbi:hypothetical protein [Cetobacterium somerae]|uniref:hypothetical protein n=1 Tax=Cetobacterium somerae TaxID=188913 RepID=UPI0038928493